MTAWGSRVRGANVIKSERHRIFDIRSCFISEAPRPFLWDDEQEVDIYSEVMGMAVREWVAMRDHWPAFEQWAHNLYGRLYRGRGRGRGSGSGSGSGPAPGPSSGPAPGPSSRQ
ncbi:hypothetical protein LSTR_LSTR009284 [Laodelphax striatellus]|uniref:Uncharacterized protein n=1 Tax=Laodelphax striatellus TaxID=195883 RepID=A0A482XL17_LAOST|nr:hypothetical protein LSTR_LSTR009284 [Laodelphax striatellus]